MSDEKYTITIECNKAAKEDLMPLLETLKWCANVGASRTLKIDGVKPDRDETYSIDGDGPSDIYSIKTSDPVKEASMSPDQASKALAFVAQKNPEVAREMLAARTALMKVSSRRGMTRMASGSLFGQVTKYCAGLARFSQKLLRKVPGLTAHKVSEAHHYAETTDKATRKRYRLQYGVDACDLDHVLVVVKIMQGGEELHRVEYDGALDAAEIADRACNELMRLIGM